jgi:hypothetical protein
MRVEVLELPMSLFVRVYTNFFSHRKTAKLRVLLGDDALWVPIKLWSYAAENQPDGDFSSYAPEEIAMLIGYTKNATSMLQALLDVGLMDADPLRVHDWAEHNSYHETYAIRAKKAAVARWKGQDKKGDRKERKGKEASIATSMLAACELIYAEYPRKVGKPKALKAIEKAVREFSDAVVLEKTKAYAAARRGEDSQFTPHPATWFNQSRFNDDPATWKSLPTRRNGAPVQKTYESAELERIQRSMDAEADREERKLKADAPIDMSWMTRKMKQANP